MLRDLKNFFLFCFANTSKLASVRAREISIQIQAGNEKIFFELRAHIRFKCTLCARAGVATNKMWSKSPDAVLCAPSLASPSDDDVLAQQLPDTSLPELTLSPPGPRALLANFFAGLGVDGHTPPPEPSLLMFHALHHACAQAEAESERKGDGDTVGGAGDDPSNSQESLAATVLYARNVLLEDKLRQLKAENRRLRALLRAQDSDPKPLLYSPKYTHRSPWEGSANAMARAILRREQEKKRRRRLTPQAVVVPGTRLTKRRHRE